MIDIVVFKCRSVFMRSRAGSMLKFKGGFCTCLGELMVVDLWIYRLIYLSPPLNAIPLTKLREYQQPKLPDALTIVFACEGLSPRLWKSVATTLSIINHQQ